jgi:hypothetical protein
MRARTSAETQMHAGARTQPGTEQKGQETESALLIEDEDNDEKFTIEEAHLFSAVSLHNGTCPPTKHPHPWWGFSPDIENTSPHSWQSRRNVTNVLYQQPCAGPRQT